MSIKIGLIGAPGAGKDTFADFLVNNKNFIKLAFADRIKEEYYKFSGITEEYFKSVRGQSEEQKIRDGLWSYSDEMRKKFGKLHFVSPVVGEVRNSDSNVVVTDIRTQDELYELNGVCDGMVVIIRDLKLDAVSSKFPGTRLKFIDLMGMPVLWNHSDGVAGAQIEFELFYNNIVKFF